MDHQVSGLDAKHIRRPGQDALLTVTGECKLPATFRAVLEVAEQQGDDPSQLVLDLNINVPSGKPPTRVEGMAVLNIIFKLLTDEPYTSVKITDLQADPETTDTTVWELPVKQVNWGTVAAAPESQRWKKSNADLSHRQN